MAPPFRPLGLDHAVLWVRDLAAAERWYRDVLGCEPAARYDEIAMVHLWFGAIRLGLWDASDPRAAYAAPETPGTNVDHLALAVGPFDADALRTHLAAHDVAIEREVHQVGARGMGHAIYIRDPWGNRLELKGPPVEPPP
ncbi:VOC family protein [Jannaschia aquimarina]|uniref:Virulence protein n=1 Tax=Jannaschia aquimarina TaxID=935700 RepID=A0A0D1EEF2_9RHOB|nr:VOC family protein [Jannaschia aquimarina]KIT14270.1 Virulence protein [Jannaschia aquimarina]SNS49654.1 glyoxylase I family protein [Jannaschia aquimarina]